MKIIRIPCKYNTLKVYLVKVYSDRHRYINQEVNGKLLNKRWQRATEKHIQEYLVMPNV